MNSSLLIRGLKLSLMVSVLGFAQGRAAISAPKPASLENQVSALVTNLLTAWRRADARAISEQYEPDGDFVSPLGDHAVGRRAVEAFYQGAFDAGYAKSDATATVLHVRGVSPEYAIIDGSWMIQPTKASKIAQSESGLFVAMLHQHNDRWWIVALREQTSAQMMREMSPTSSTNRPMR
jgi:uncharacterized protein (TIGR02246 family)